MVLSDIASAVLIIIIFAVLLLFITLSIGIARIRNNWDEYKCNPAVIPFASVFGHDPVTTFNQCIQLSQGDFMSGFLDPIYKALANFAESGALFTSIFEMLKLGMNDQQMGMFNLAETIGAKMKSVVTELDLLFISVTDMFAKLGSAITVIYYLIQTGVGTSSALWEELPGTVIRLLTGTSKEDFDSTKSSTG